MLTGDMAEALINVSAGKEEEIVARMDTETIDKLSALENARFKIVIDKNDVKPVPLIFQSKEEFEKRVWERYAIKRDTIYTGWAEISDPEVETEFREILKTVASQLFSLIDFPPEEDENIGIPPYKGLVRTYNDIIKELLNFLSYATNFRRIDVEELVSIRKKYLVTLERVATMLASSVEEYTRKYGIPIHTKLTPFIKKNIFSLTVEERKIYEWNIMNVRGYFHIARATLLNDVNRDYIRHFEENPEAYANVLIAYDRLSGDFIDKFRGIIYEHEVVESIVQKNAFGEVAYIIVKDDLNARINIGVAHDNPVKLPKINFDAIEEMLKRNYTAEVPLEIRLEFKNEEHRNSLPLLDVDEVSIQHAYKPVRVRGVVGKLQPKITRLWRVRVYDKDAEDGWKHRYLLLPQVLYTERGTKAKILPAVDNIRIESQFGELQLFPEEIEKSRKASTSIKFVLEGSLVDKVVPGERYEFIGIPFYRDPAKDGDIVLYVTDIRRIDLFSKFILTEEDIKKFKKIKREFETTRRAEVEELSRRIGLKILPMVYVYLTSFAPEVRLTRTNAMLKLAFLIPAVRGALKNTREIPHSLVIGEPSTGKTHLAKELAKIHPKALYVSGKSATGIGLTVSVNKDKVTGQWYASPGMIVLADGGVLIIDELDKANKEDRSNLYEALEDGKVTVAKATVFKTMPARTAVIGIANPPSYTLKSVKDAKSLFKKAGFDPAFVSRLDIIVVALDETEYEDDIQDALSIFNYVTGGEFRTVMSYEDLSKLLAYSMSIRPRIPRGLGRYLAERYAELRQRARETGDDAYKIKKRNLEGILRIATALAKLNLDEEVTKDHIDLAIQIFEYSQMIRKEAEKEVKVSKKEVKEQAMAIITEENLKFVGEKEFRRIAEKVVEKFNYDESLTDQIEVIVAELITKDLMKEKLVEFDPDKNIWKLKLNTLTDYLPGERESEYLSAPEEEKVSEAKELIMNLSKDKGEIDNGLLLTVKTELRERHGKISEQVLERIIGKAIEELVRDGVLREEYRDGERVLRVVKIPKGSL